MAEARWGRKEESGMMLKQYPLEPEQEELLVWMVEVERSVPREKRDGYHYMEASDGYLLHHFGTGEKMEVNRSDFLTLAESGLIRVEWDGQHTARADVRQPGLVYYAELKKRSGEPVRNIEKPVRAFLDGATLKGQYPRAYQKWHRASELLWGEESDRASTEIGHNCREAFQEFVTRLIEIHNPVDAPPDPQKTVARLQAVQAKYAERFGKTESKFLVALVTYFGAVADLHQRQEHGAQKEGTPLNWEDGRRVVFQTALVMFEVDRALQRVASTPNR